MAGDPAYVITFKQFMKTLGFMDLAQLEKEFYGESTRAVCIEHEHILEAVQRRLDEHPEKMRQRRQSVEHPFGTIKSWMGSMHFQMKKLKHVGTEMALHILAVAEVTDHQGARTVNRDLTSGKTKGWNQ